MSSLVVRFAAALLCCAALPAAAQDVPIYTDGLNNNFQDYSYGGGSNFVNPAPFHNGAPSIAFTGNNTFNAVSFAHPSGTFASSSYSSLRFFVNGGASGAQSLSLLLQTNSNVASTPVLNNSVALDAYIAGGAVPANAWAQVDVPFAALAFNNDGSFDRIDIQTGSGTQPVVYIDDVSLVAAGAAPALDAVFGDSFEPEYLLVPQYNQNTNGSIKVYQHTLGTTNYAFVREAPLSAAGTVHPNSLAFAPDGNLWVVDDASARLRRYTLQSILTDPAPAPTVSVGPVGSGASIFDLAFFGSFAYVSQSDFGATNQILKFSIANLNAGTNSSTALSDAGHPLSVPAGLAFDAQGRLWIGNYNGGANPTIMRMNVSSGAIDKIAASVAVGARASLSNPEGMAFDTYGNLWVGNNGEPTASVYADWQINDVGFGAATAPMFLLDIAPGVTNPDAGHSGFAGGIVFDARGALRVNYEDADAVLGYALRAAPRSGGQAGFDSYATTPLATLDNATVDPGRGGMAVWPRPPTVHVR